MHQLRTVGIEIERIVDHVTARPPTLAEAKLMGIEDGVSVLALTKRSISTTGRVVEVSEAVFPGDTTELVYNTPLEPWD